MEIHEFDALSNGESRDGTDVDSGGVEVGTDYWVFPRSEDWE
jgi:hypothetical protein